MASLFTLFLLLYAVLGLIGGFSYREARKHRQYAFTVPALNSGFTPQGVAYVGDGTYLTTGYSSKTDETLLYIVKGKSATRVLLGDFDGPLYGHGGGVAVSGKYVFVTKEDTLNTYLLSEVLAAGEERILPVGEVVLPCKASFCFADGEHLYAGEFYRKGNYETEASHRMQTPNGDYNTAFVACYALSDEGDLVQPYPVQILSITGLVQGFAVHDGVYMLSRSYGLVNSKLEYYTAPYEAGETDVTLRTETVTVPLFVLDSRNKFRTLTLPSFSEDLDVVDGRVVMMQEAACNKYIIGKLFLADKAYSFPIFEKPLS